MFPQLEVKLDVYIYRSQMAQIKKEQKFLAKKMKKKNMVKNSKRKEKKVISLTRIIQILKLGSSYRNNILMGQVGTSMMIKNTGMKKEKENMEKKKRTKMMQMADQGNVAEETQKKMMMKTSQLRRGVKSDVLIIQNLGYKCDFIYSRQ